mgnify:CR=1 FL=1
MAESIDQMAEIPSIAGRADEITAEMLEVMRQQYELLQDVEREGSMTFGDNDRLVNNRRRFNQLVSDLEDWVRENGSRYGLALRK